ncbi:hypothetical protein [Streptomyces griseoluteus]|uniref:hypothetical protein n=1 Tax=Streptomyces griseoluteus TaxID=29306 RepID=UPI00365B23F7
MSLQSLSSYETGRTDPTDETLARVSAASGGSVIDLVGRGARAPKNRAIHR